GRIELVADLERGDFGRERVEEVLVDAGRRQDALRGDAHLARVRVAGGGDRGGDLVQVRVRHHDHRRVRAELHGHPLDAGRLADVLADVAAAGERDLAHASVSDQQVADLPARAGERVD